MQVTRPKGSKHYASIPLFDPREGTCVIGPPQPGAGHWAGACSVVHDESSARIYLYYRVRHPRPIRGGHCYVAESKDGVSFETIWSARREDFDSVSIEKGSILKTPEGTWRLYLSYVDPADGRWRTDLMEASSPSAFDVQQRVKVLTAEDILAEGVKDPYAFSIAGMTYLLLSYAPRPERVAEPDRAAMHATSDVYNTGICKSSSGLAISEDGVSFQWAGDVFAPREEGWDAYASRLGAFLYRPPAFIGFYDGSASVDENYEEKTGIAISFDLRHWERLTKAGPVLTSPHASGSLRYLDPLDMGDEVLFYYEYAREDGSHELRMNRVQL